MTTDTLAPVAPRLSPAATEALLHIGVAILAVIVSVSSFAVTTVFGIAATFVMILVTAVALPAAVPLVIATALMFQNTVVAWYAPLIPNNDAFDALRGANFVLLMAAFAAFYLAGFQRRMRAVAPLRPWLVWGVALGGVIAVYLALGAATGEPKDAIVYFRNIITPIACFYVAIIAASVYRVDLRTTVAWLAGVAIAYGYCELFFTMDFLSLFHGDVYIERNIYEQIQTGVWEEALRETGFVLRGLEDVMMTNLFNLPGFGDIFPKIFRVGGPNFHPIAFAYALSVTSTWLLFNRRWVLPLVALPLLIAIGSKGALALLLLALFVRVATPLLGARVTMVLTICGAVLWVALSIVIGIRGGDYHVLGLFAGLREFLSNPVGIGLGFGGNLSSTSVNINWDLAQAEGFAGTPMESALGVLLYQMGVSSAAIFGFVAAIAWTSWKGYRRSGDLALLFPTVATLVISGNAVLQEEAYFSPLALGLCLLLGGVSLGSYWRRSWAEQQRASR